METGEVFAWLIFMVVITLLFFAAFGTSQITEDTIEEYMENIMQKIRSGERQKWVLEWNVLNVDLKQSQRG